MNYFRNPYINLSAILLLLLSGCSNSDSDSEPLNQELSQTEGFSIVRVEQPGISSVTHNLEGTQLRTVKVDGVGLPWILQKLDREEYWYMGLENLPGGFYRFSIDNLPMPSETAFTQCIEVFEKSFDLEITITDYPWLSCQVVMPQQLPDFMTPSTEDDRFLSRSWGPGYEFKKYTMKQLSNWLQSELQKPIDFDSGDHSGYYNFSIACDVFDTDTIIDFLKENGFTFTETEISQRTVIIKSQKTNTPERKAKFGSP